MVRYRERRSDFDRFVDFDCRLQLDCRVLVHLGPATPRWALKNRVHFAATVFRVVWLLTKLAFSFRQR